MKNFKKKMIAVVSTTAMTLGMTIAPPTASAQDNNTDVEAPHAVPVSQVLFIPLNGPTSLVLLGIGLLSFVVNMLTNGKSDTGSSIPIPSSLNSTPSISPVTSTYPQGEKADPSSDFCQKNFFNSQEAQRQFLVLLNRDRIKRGLQPVVPGAKNTIEADILKRNGEIFASKKENPHGGIRHFLKSELHKYNIGEIAQSNSANCDPARYYQGFYDSPGHRSIMMDPTSKHVWTGTFYREDTHEFAIYQEYD